MRFNHPDATFLFALLPLLIGFFLYQAAKRKSAWKALADPELKSRLMPNRSPWRSALKNILKAGALVFLVLALMEPQWGTREEEVTIRGADLMILMDVSNSMLAQDLKPSRLEWAKRKLHDLIDMLAGDRVGLVAFAGRSFLLSPLTIDYGTLEMFADELSPETIPVQGTDLSSALSLAVKALGDKDSAKAILIYSDGEDHSERLEKMVDQLKERKIQIFVLGFGSTEGAPVPESGGGFKKNENNETVVSRLKEDALKELALKTGGAYVRAVTGDADLKELYVKGIRGAMELSELKASRKQVWESRFYWPLGIAAALLFLERGIAEARRLKPSAG